MYVHSMAECVQVYCGSALLWLHSCSPCKYSAWSIQTNMWTEYLTTPGQPNPDMGQAPYNLESGLVLSPWEVKNNIKVTQHTTSVALCCHTESHRLIKERFRTIRLHEDYVMISFGQTLLTHSLLVKCAGGTNWKLTPALHDHHVRSYQMCQSV